MDEWYALLPEDIRGCAYGAPNGELAWLHEEALTVVSILQARQWRLLGVDIWRAAPGGPIVTPYCMDMSDEPVAEGHRQAVWFINGFNWNPEDPGRDDEPLFNFAAEFIRSATRH